MLSDKELRLLLAQVLGALDQDRKMLAAMDSRIALIFEEIRRTGETVTRLKLMADNARRMAASQAEALQRLSDRLDGAGGEP